MLTNEEMNDKALSFYRERGWMYASGFEDGAVWANDANMKEIEVLTTARDVLANIVRNEVKSGLENERAWQRKHDAVLELALAFQKENMEMKSQHGKGSVEMFSVADNLPPTDRTGQSDSLLCIERSGWMFVGWYNSNTRSWHISHYSAQSTPVNDVTHWALLPSMPVNKNKTTLP